MRRGGGVKQPDRARDGDEWKGIGVSGEGREIPWVLKWTKIEEDKKGGIAVKKRRERGRMEM